MVLKFQNLNSYNHIQAIIVKNNNVYKETTRGTKKLIQSIKKKIKTASYKISKTRS